ncbi:unnamed protein product, partial [Prorocentrum cordatum]
MHSCRARRPSPRTEVGLSSTLQSLLRGVVSGNAEQVQAAMATALNPQPPGCAELEDTEVRCLEHQSAAATELLDRVEAQVGHTASSLQDKREALRALSADGAGGHPGQLYVVPFPPLRGLHLPSGGRVPRAGPGPAAWAAGRRPAARHAGEAGGAGEGAGLDAAGGGRGCPRARQRDRGAAARAGRAAGGAGRRRWPDGALAVSPRGAAALSLAAAAPARPGRGPGALTRLAVARGGRGFVGRPGDMAVIWWAVGSRGREDLWSRDRVAGWRGVIRLVLSLALSGWACEARRLRAPDRLLRLWAAGGGAAELGAWLGFWRCLAKEASLRREAALRWAALRFGCTEPSLLRAALNEWRLALARQGALSAAAPSVAPAAEAPEPDAELEGLRRELAQLRQ